jgi:hypothetical protein
MKIATKPYDDSPEEKGGKDEGNEVASECETYLSI